MGLIIKDKIPMLMKGYPTVSDKYNVAGAELVGATEVNFGDPLVWAASVANNEGYAVKSAIGTGVVTAAADFAGFAVATNVKLATEWPGKTVTYKAGEAVNLLVNGYIAVEFDATTTVANIKPNAKVYITSAGVLTLVATNNFDTGYTCTGIYEDKGTSTAHKYIVEICRV